MRNYMPNRVVKLCATKKQQASTKLHTYNKTKNEQSKTQTDAILCLENKRKTPVVRRKANTKRNSKKKTIWQKYNNKKGTKENSTMVKVMIQKYTKTATKLLPNIFLHAYECACA
ncbi:unnamed protein product [Ceratitis capitata]|uniref:(Mediterranean fruit fly) hypothetical protein n=1 Tax=Ceratitis capitata TaxID=7213 RepID=A0A811UQS4_CERCA|nr:unnamed protein product [Ceratitis capitata]